MPRYYIYNAYGVRVLFVRKLSKVKAILAISGDCSNISFDSEFDYMYNYDKLTQVVLLKKAKYV